MHPSGLLEKPAVLYPLALLALGLVGFLDHVSGTELSFSIFYLLPVGMVALNGTARTSILLSLACAVVWGFLDIRVQSYTHWAIGYWNTFVRFAFFVIVALTLLRLRDAVARERALASTDPLTGVANSRAFYQALSREVLRMGRTGRPLVVAYLDVDDFKSINDRAGHLMGDELLRLLSSTLTKHLRTVDLVARLGGDEFGILFPETDADAAKKLLDRVRTALANEFKVQPSRTAVTFSIGAVAAHSAPKDIEELVHTADELMYRVKKSGKNDLRIETLPTAGGAS